MFSLGYLFIIHILDRTAEEDIAALSKQFSDAVINVDKDNVIPIRKASSKYVGPQWKDSIWAEYAIIRS
jgi:hypothetical protein